MPLEQYVHLHCLAEPALLRALVQHALPATAPGNTATPEMAVAVRSLCQMLQALTGVAALCQKALIFTAHQADFVRRLWCSYLQVCSTSHCAACVWTTSRHAAVLTSDASITALLAVLARMGFMATALVTLQFDAASCCLRLSDDMVGTVDPLRAQYRPPALTCPSCRQLGSISSGRQAMTAVLIPAGCCHWWSCHVCTPAT